MSAVSGGEPRALAHSVKPPLAVPRRLLRLRSDAVLAERVALGDETAFDVLYERHRPVVLAVCMGILGTPHDAEDATQETFSALALALRGKAPAELRPWLIRVARNASIDTTRRRKHRLLTLDGEIPDIPTRANAGKADLDVVLDGIRELPEQQRTALLMRELGGHSYAEIAEFLETDEDAVRGLIARARVGLRSHREATELPCATARACIETEPDGRRYDKTVRRHLRGCASCRAYRIALRGDAKALRAALPLQTSGAIGPGSGLTAGGLSAGKAALLGAGMSQVAAACAASVCAVGTVGGVVLINPFHHLTTDNYVKPAALAAAKPHRRPAHKTLTPAHGTTHTATVTSGASTYPAPAGDTASRSQAATIAAGRRTLSVGSITHQRHSALQLTTSRWQHVPIRAVATLEPGIAAAQQSNSAARPAGASGNPGAARDRWSVGGSGWRDQGAPAGANGNGSRSAAGSANTQSPSTGTAGAGQSGSGTTTGWGQQSTPIQPAATQPASSPQTGAGQHTGWGRNGQGAGQSGVPQASATSGQGASTGSGWGQNGRGQSHGGSGGWGDGSPSRGTQTSSFGSSPGGRGGTSSPRPGGWSSGSSPSSVGWSSGSSTNSGGWSSGGSSSNWGGWGQ